MNRLMFCLLMLLSFSAKSQEKGSLYVFDSDWKPTVLSNAHYLMHSYPVNDTCWQLDYYNFIGPLIKTEQYRGKDGNDLHGICRYYDSNGMLDSMTTYSFGKKNGDSWKLQGDSQTVRMIYVYQNDSLISFTDPTKKKKDSVRIERDEKESEFPGGLKAWARYLKKTIKYPERAMNTSVEGGVWVRFVVDKEGVVVSPSISRSVEYSLDEEAIKVIMASGKWLPAYQDGHVVKSYKMQPINFRFR